MYNRNPRSIMDYNFLSKNFQLRNCQSKRVSHHIADNKDVKTIRCQAGWSSNKENINSRVLCEARQTIGGIMYNRDLLNESHTNKSCNDIENDVAYDMQEKYCKGFYCCVEKMIFIKQWQTQSGVNFAHGTSAWQTLGLIGSLCSPGKQTRLLQVVDNEPVNLLWNRSLPCVVNHAPGPAWEG